ncbi:MAG: hypothetical protein HY077_08205 [Elusimicrobia bacterium]|nr:hypothetical protein [Elusimicrobiota bacterium]
MRLPALVLIMMVWAVSVRPEEPFLNAEQKEWLENLFRNSTAPPKDPLYKGLPDSITRDFPGREGFVAFEHIPGEDPPVGGRLRISDPDLKLRDVFDDESFARLPVGATIRRDTSRSPEAWDYPVGTRVMHKLFFKTAPPRLFELRLAQKLPDGKWGFGIYMAEEGSDTLQLHREGFPPLAFDLVIAGKPVRVELNRLIPGSCRACHWARGHGNHQFPDMEHVGPCGFVPANDDLLGRWARDYAARHGASPFS